MSISVAPAYVVRRVDDEPSEILPGIVYVVGEPGWPWFAILRCPCECSAVIRLSLVPNDRPRWSVRVHSEWAASIYPSVARVVGCRSHFIIRRGRLIWAMWTRPSRCGISGTRRPPPREPL